MSVFRDEPEPSQLETGEHYIVISADAHAAPDDFDHYLSYVDPQHRDAVAELGELSTTAIQMFGGNDVGALDEPDPVRATAMRRLGGMGVDVDAARDWFARYSTDWVFAGDANGRRLQVLEDQGIHAEVVYSGPILAGSVANAMFLGAYMKTGLELVWPALHAYNRWLSDFCNAAPGRRAGVMPIDLHDMDRAVQEIEWARGAGIFGGIVLPAMSPATGLRGYADEYFTPFFAACEANDMVINMHTGQTGGPTDAKYLYDAEHGGQLGLYEVFVFTRRPLWFMVLGGVFDRHPGLKVVVSENGVQWLPALVRDMEAYFDTHGAAPLRRSLKMRPGEYIERHVMVGGSLMRRDDWEQRADLGVDHLMWGSDYPHVEGAAPVHREVLAHVFGGTAEGEIRKTLGLNALRVWDFDEAQLRQVANRVGPTVDDLRAQLPLRAIPPTFSWSLARLVPLVS